MYSNYFLSYMYMLLAGINTFSAFYVWVKRRTFFVSFWPWKSICLGINTNMTVLYIVVTRWMQQEELTLPKHVRSHPFLVGFHLLSFLGNVMSTIVFLSVIFSALLWFMDFDYPLVSQNLPKDINLESCGPILHISCKTVSNCIGVKEWRNNDISHFPISVQCCCNWLWAKGLYFSPPFSIITISNNFPNDLVNCYAMYIILSLFSCLFLTRVNQLWLPNCLKFQQIRNYYMFLWSNFGRLEWNCKKSNLYIDILGKFRFQWISGLNYQMFHCN